MNRLLRNELAEICILSIIMNRPVNGCKLILEVDKLIGIENLTREFCFYELRKEGYISVVYDEEKQGAYHITPKGIERLSDFLKLHDIFENICQLICCET